MEKKTPGIQMETPLNLPSSSYNESTKLSHEEKACEKSESMKLAHGKGVVEEAHEEQDSVDPTWMTSMEKKLVAQPRKIKVSSSSFKTSIHTIPPNLCRQSKNAYVPQVVSIGPLHHHERSGKLQAVEEHKWRILNEMVSSKGKVWFEQSIVAVKHLEKEARDCYSQVIELNSNSFVEMMLLDGCFLIKLLFRGLFREFPDDPIFHLSWLYRDLSIDLVMLENQIPFFVLQTLCDLMDIPSSSLSAAALNFFRQWPRYQCFLPEIERTLNSNLPIHHLLHLLHENIVLSTEKNYPVANKWESIFRCASKLQESGIKFEKRDDKNGARNYNFLDITFEKGIIGIPCIFITDKTNAILRNLIAFEQCYNPCKKYITTYTYFMDWLLNNGEDVEILLRKRIIDNKLGTDEDVADLFNNINKEVSIFPQSFYLLDVCKDINRHCDASWHRLRATLMHDYFKNPWAVISFTAAAFLLLFTMTQAFFSAFPKFTFGN